MTLACTVCDFEATNTTDWDEHGNVTGHRLIDTERDES